MTYCGTGLVGSVNVELEKNYRVMLLKIANELTHDECEQVAFVAKLPSPTCVPEPGKMNVRLHLMSTLESLGHIGPLNVDFLETMLDAVGKKNLLEIIDQYKKSPLYKEAKKRIEDHQKKAEKKKSRKKSKFPDTQATDCSIAAQDLSSEETTEKMHKFKECYATLLTQFSQVALLMRSAIESEDLGKIEDTFLSIASDGDAITRTLLKNLVAAGIRRGSNSSSSSNSPVESPTEEVKRVFEGDVSPPASLKEESQAGPMCRQYHSRTAHTDDSASPSSTLQRKNYKPLPLPRKKRPQAQSNSQSASAHSLTKPNKFVTCHQESQAYSASTLMAASLYLPQSASTSCLNCSSDYSGDYSGGTGTGDSGVGDIRREYKPSQKSLDELDPTRRQLEYSEDRPTQSSEGGTDERPRYMKLKTVQKPSSDGYMKPLRAQSLDDFLQQREQVYH